MSTDIKFELEPIEGFWQERGRITRGMQAPMDEFILTKLKLRQLREHGIIEPALANNLNQILEQIKNILIDS